MLPRVVRRPTGDDRHHGQPRGERRRAATAAGSGRGGVGIGRRWVPACRPGRSAARPAPRPGRRAPATAPRDGPGLRPDASVMRAHGSVVRLRRVMRRSLSGMLLPLLLAVTGVVLIIVGQLDLDSAAGLQPAADSRSDGHAGRAWPRPRHRPAIASGGQTPESPRPSRRRSPGTGWRCRSRSSRWASTFRSHKSTSLATDSFPPDDAAFILREARSRVAARTRTCSATPLLDPVQATLERAARRARSRS